MIYDNSTGHGVHADDALKWKVGWGKGPGGVNAPGAPARVMGKDEKKRKVDARPKLRDGEFCHPELGRQTQVMHDRHGTFKGVAAVLRERGRRFPATKRLKCTVKQREDCWAAKEIPKSEVLEMGHSGGCRPGDDCCLVAMLSGESDFKEQKSLLVELWEARGHLCRLIPKCHPEINAIEHRWAKAKDHTRKVCNCSMEGLRREVPQRSSRCARDHIRPNHPAVLQKGASVHIDVSPRGGGSPALETS